MAWKVSFCKMRNNRHLIFITLNASEYDCRYKRVFCVGTKAITTLNPTTHEITNQVKIIVAYKGFPYGSRDSFAFVVDVQRVCRDSSKF